MNCKVRFGYTPTDFWEGRKAKALTELCDVSFTAPDAQTAIEVAESIVDMVIEKGELQVDWTQWGEAYLWQNPSVPELQSATIRERYSKGKTVKGRYYAFLSTTEHLVEKESLERSTP